jgi:hypothetical protein
VQRARGHAQRARDRRHPLPRAEPAEACHRLAHAPRRLAGGRRSACKHLDFRVQALRHAIDRAAPGETRLQSRQLSRERLGWHHAHPDQRQRLDRTDGPRGGGSEA